MTDTITNAELRRAAEQCRVVSVGCRVVGRIQLDKRNGESKHDDIRLPVRRDRRD